MRRVGMVTILASLLLAFQNCAPPATSTDEAITTVDLQQGSGSLMINRNVASDEDEGQASNEVEFVNPIAIDFTNSQNLDHVEFRIDLSSGLVSRLADGHAMSQLNDHQWAQLKALLKNSFVSNILDLPGNAHLMCSQSIRLAYANLVTDQGTYALGGGSNGCVTDLYKQGSNQNAGLGSFLRLL